MSLPAEWTTELDESTSEIDYHPGAGVLTVALDPDATGGPAVCVLSAAGGRHRGTVRTTATPDTAYEADADLLFATTDDDHVYAIDPATADCRWETQASTVEAVIDDAAILRAGRVLRAHRLADSGREWQAVLPDDAYAVTPHGDALVVKVGEYGDMSFCPECGTDLSG